MNKELNKYLVERWANNCSLSAEEYFININRDLYQETVDYSESLQDELHNK